MPLHLYMLLHLYNATKGQNQLYSKSKPLLKVGLTLYYEVPRSR